MDDARARARPRPRGARRKPRRERRPSPCARPSWLFAETARGTEASAHLYSLVERAKACGLDPITNLRHVFTALPRATTLANIVDRAALAQERGCRRLPMAYSDAAVRQSLHIVLLFAAVGLGALAVTILVDPSALVPRSPYVPWVFPRLLVTGALAFLALIVAAGTEEEFAEAEENGSPEERIIRWRVVGLALLISVLASATFVAASALTDRFDRIF